MASKTKSGSRGFPIGKAVAQNRRARHDYVIEDTFEAGIVLLGTEVKALRQGGVSINEADADEKEGEVYLVNAFISEYGSAKYFSHEPRRPRKLLMHQREISKLVGAVKREGMTLVPLSLYFNSRGFVKVALALARGKRKADVRATIKEREWRRQRARLLR